MESTPKQLALTSSFRYYENTMSTFREKRFLPARTADATERNKLGKAIKDRLSREPGLLFAYLHGSFVTSETFRDIDIGLYARDHTDVSYEAALSYELSQTLGQEVEVKVINGAPVAFQMAVLRDDRLLFSSDDAVRTSFIEEVGRRYRTYAHFRNVYMEAIGVNDDRMSKGVADIREAEAEIRKLIACGKV